MVRADDTSRNRSDSQVNQIPEYSRQHQQATSQRLQELNAGQLRTWEALRELEMRILDQENAIRARG